MSKRSLETGDEPTQARKRLQKQSNRSSVNPDHAIAISKLSDEVILNVFNMLSLEHILSCQSVCHRWHQIATDPELWKRLFFARFVKPRLAHVHSRTRTRIASRDWWNTETTHSEGQPRKDWKQLFKLRHNWRRGRCEVSEMDISESPARHVESELRTQTSFWEPPVPEVSAPLVQFNGKIFIAVDKDTGVRAWDIGRADHGKRKLIGNRNFRTYEQGWKLGDPTAVGIDGVDDTMDVVVGFESGGVMLLRLDPEADVSSTDFGFNLRCILPPKVVPEKVLHLTYSNPYLLTLDAKHNLHAYLFDSSFDQGPRLLATLHAQGLRGPCNLTLRKSKWGGEETVTASIAYSMPLFHGGWSVGIQEVILDVSSPTGIAQTRIGTCIPSTYQLHIHPDQQPSRVRSISVPVASPTSISYSHPYLLTSHRDNTLTLYLARSNDKEIIIGQPRRLWGHTAGVARAGVAGRGRAVSVSTVGSEVRVWELESIAAAVAKADTDVEDRGIVGIIESVRVDAPVLLKAGREFYLDEIPRNPSVEWVGFDDEKVLVVTCDQDRDQNVTMYDFTV